MFEFLLKADSSRARSKLCAALWYRCKYCCAKCLLHAASLLERSLHPIEVYVFGISIFTMGRGGEGRVCQLVCSEHGLLVSELPRGRGCGGGDGASPLHGDPVSKSSIRSFQGVAGSFDNNVMYGCIWNKQQVSPAEPCV